MAIKDLLKIREAVAINNGFSEINTSKSSSSNGFFVEMHGVKNGEYQLIPTYEASLDAIAGVLFDNKIDFALHVAFKDSEIGCLATNLATQRESFSTDPVHALCYLFLHHTK